MRPGGGSYFGDKEGLYRACAEAIVERYRGHTGGAAREAREALDENCVAETARAHLKAVVGALARFLIGSTEAAHWAPFVAREMRDPGPAFDLLYDRLWRPGVELTARLIARIEDASESNPGVRIEALLLIAGLLAFQSGRGIALRAMHWRTIGPDELALVRARLDERIDAIGGPSSFGGF
jgi:AcrR family transcriptional regulator